MRPTPRSSLPTIALALGVALAACGDAVTNPSLRGFPSDPRVIQGDWVTLFRETDGDVLQLPGELTPAGGRILGSFQFNRFGQFWQIQFNDGTWDGTRVRFSVQMTIGGVTHPVDWTATYFPADQGEPTMLLLSSPEFGGPSNAFVYLRPRDAG